MSLEVRSDLALVLDVGSAWVKASVIGRVRDRWRVTAHAAQPTGWGAAELRRSLVEQLEASGDARLSGRYDELLSAANRIECHTARRPRRVAVVAVSRELSGGTARRAAEAAGWEVTDMVTLDDGRSLADRLATLQRSEADGWVIAGGFDGGAPARALEAAALVASARRAGAGPVVWAGSDRLAETVSALFEHGAVDVVANVRPEAGREEQGALRDHLRSLLHDGGAGPDGLRLASVTLPRTVAAIAVSGALKVLAVDVGARNTSLALAEADGTVTVRAHSTGGLAGAAGTPGAAERVARLAADAGDDAAVADLLQTLRARPSTLPQTAEELAATQAVARMQIAALLDEEIGSLDLVIGAGQTIGRAPHPAQSMRMLLDGVRTPGVTQFAIDPASLLGPLGSLEGDEVREAIELLADDLLVPLGTAVVTRGGAPGEVAMRVTVHRAGWPALGPIEVRNGALQLVPLPAGQAADLVIEPGRGVVLGTGRRASRIHASATGGAVGLVLDARGVPIGLPRRADDRRAVLAAWTDALTRERERLS